MILYFVDDMVEGVYKDKIFSYPFKNSVLKGEIINKDEFIQEFNKLVKKEKIKSKLFGNTITILKQPFYNEGYLFFLQNILEELGFIKINYMVMEELLDDNTYIEVNKTYMVIHAEKSFYFDFDVFNDIPFLINYFKNYYKGNVVLFGKNKNIPNIRVRNIFLYYYEDYVNFVVDCLQKVNEKEA